MRIKFFGVFENTATRCANIAKNQCRPGVSQTTQPIKEAALASSREQSHGIQRLPGGANNNR